MLDDSSQLTISPELDQPLQILRRNLEFLVKAVSTACYYRIWRDALRTIHDLLWQDVLLRQSFSTSGAAQFTRDLSAIFALVNRFVTGGSGAFELLSEGATLLSLPVEAAPEAAEGEGSGKAMTLKEATDRVFTDNDEARGVLEELRLGSLTPSNARQILQRRVENNENVGW